MVHAASRRLSAHPPPGPFRRGFWRSPLRGPWFTAVLGLTLLVGITVVFATGLLSYAAYNPDLPGNDKTPGHGLLGGYLFRWPTGPPWLYRFNQGVHVTLGLALVPVLLAKLWSVIPKLFAWPPASSPAQALERLSLFLLVAGAIVEFATGIANIQVWYVFPASFYTLHFYGAWVFIAAFVAHVTIKLARAVAAVRTRDVPAEGDPTGLTAPDPHPPTISRRGALLLVAAGSLTVVALSVGQSIGGVFRRTALLAPRGQVLGSGPNDFQINKTAGYRGVTERMTGPSWRLELRGPGPTRRLRRAELLALPQHTASLPIACVEGWSTSNQEWTGVRLADLARLAGASGAEPVLVESLQRGGSFGSASLAGNQVADPRSLLALRVNGADLSLDHGYPARVIVPAAPGVHNTKWVRRITFTG